VRLNINNERFGLNLKIISYKKILIFNRIFVIFTCFSFLLCRAVGYAYDHYVSYALRLNGWEIHYTEKRIKRAPETTKINPHIILYTKQ